MRQQACMFCDVAILCLSFASTLLPYSDAFTPAPVWHKHQPASGPCSSRFSGSLLSSRNDPRNQLLARFVVFDTPFKNPLWKRQQLACSPKTNQSTTSAESDEVVVRSPRRQWWRPSLSRLDTIQSAGLDDSMVLTAGLFGKVKKLHDPITYFLLGILAGFRWDWCFKSPIYWFAIGFTIKWYRARYVFKIPVWDRQPNWNNIITSKEQEKDLKALTCKNCGSTIFIAKTREFFFEGNTGIGGLGCFACGAKGRENFMDDRDRILEDVGDMDDYFEYERPLDFVSRAERRKLLKEAKGDEEKANQLLLERTAPSENIIDAVIEPGLVTEPDMKPIDSVNESVDPEMGDEIEANLSGQKLASSSGHAPDAQDEAELTVKLVEHVEPIESKAESKPRKKKSPSGNVPKTKKTVDTKKSDINLDGLDALDMDAF